jgi:hypothetical protein
MMGTVLFAFILSLFFVPMWCLGLRMVSDYKENGLYQQSSGTFAQKVSDKKLLWKVREYLLKNWPWAGKPILTCVSCMPSLHSLPVMVFVWWIVNLPLTYHFLVCLPMVMVCSSFVAGYYWSKYNG